MKKQIDFCKPLRLCGLEKVTQRKAVSELAFPEKFKVFLSGEGVILSLCERYYYDFICKRFPSDVSPSLKVFTFNEKSFSFSHVRSIFYQINNSLKSGVTSEMYYESKIIELLYTILSTQDYMKEHGCPSLPDEDYAAVVKAKDFISDNLNKCLRINELATMVHTSPAKLQSDFKTAFKCTIHEYTQSVRMQKAAELLKNSKEPIYLIAISIGCKKAGRFSETFRAAYGVTPSKYREKFNYFNVAKNI